MANVQLIVADPAALGVGDQATKTHLENIGHIVTVKSIGATTDVTGFDLLVLSSGTAGTYATRDFMSQNIPIICLERNAWASLGISNGSTGGTAIGNAGLLDLVAVGDPHPIHLGTPSSGSPAEVTRQFLLTSTTPWRYPPGVPATVITRWSASGSVSPVVLTVDEGSALLNSKTAQKRCFSIGLNNGQQTSELTTFGWNVITAAVDWVLELEGGSYDPSTLNVSVDGSVANLSWPAPGMVNATHVDVFRRGPYATEGEVPTTPFNPDTTTPVARVNIDTLSYADNLNDPGFYAWQVFPLISNS